MRFLYYLWDANALQIFWKISGQITFHQMRNVTNDIVTYFFFHRSRRIEYTIYQSFSTVRYFIRKIH